MKLEQKKGISLIVLVITIIVLIILATAIILNIDSSNVMLKANEAKSANEEAAMLEAATVAYVEYELKIAKGKLDSDEITASEYVKDSLKGKGFSKETSKRLMISNKGEIFIVKIPKGFVASDIETEDEVSEGLVIYEGTEKVSTDADAMTTRNQYVWIPVSDIEEFVRRDGWYALKEQQQVLNGLTNEPYSKSDVEIEEYKKMRSSVIKYGGFYIARYEAGTTNQRVSSTVNGTSLKNDGVTPDVLSQKEKYPYNFVGWGNTMTLTDEDIISDDINFGKGAVYLSRSVYPENSDNEVVSTLCYGVQWDAVMSFFDDVQNPKSDYSYAKKYTQNSKSMGWYIDNSEDNSEYITGKNVVTDLSDSANMVKNIYDLGGNVWEWTMEVNSDRERSYRGGSQNSNGYTHPASCRAKNDPYQIKEIYGFRVALYIK